VIRNNNKHSVTQNAIPLQRVQEFVYPKDSITRTKAIIPDFSTKHKLFTSNFQIKCEKILIIIAIEIEICLFD
jgi:hypothetical protein